jgi:dolichol-phosphate mannosyltransferase
MTVPAPSASRTLVIIPTFNEKENIAQLVTKILALYPAIDVLVVDDSSPDGTSAAVEEVQPEFGGHVRLLTREGKGGRGSAVLEGFKIALAEGYDYAFEMDADFSHKPEEIARFLEAAKNADMVVGSRYLPGSEIHHWSWKRRFFSRWANRYARLVLGIPLSDYTNGFRCYNRRALEALDLSRIHARGYVVLSEVAYQLHLKGLTIAQVPTVFVNRRRGISNLSFHEIKEAFLSVLRIRTSYADMRAGDGVKRRLDEKIGAL